MNSNRLIVCIVSAIAIITFTLISTIVWFNFFDKDTKQNIISNQLYISNNDKQVIDNIDIENTVMNIDTYNFSIENTSKHEISYKLLLTEVPLAELTDGCKEDDLLKRNELVYELSLNGKSIIKDDMSNIENNIIDIKTIDGNSTNKYELKFWIKSGTTNYLNKHYHYQINLSA